MRTAMYIFVNRGLGMSTGKLAAQTAHAAVEAYRISKKALVEDWYMGGHYTKLVMLATDAEHMTSIKEFLEDRGFKTAQIIDEGMTEIAPFSKTALGVEIVDREDPHTNSTFSRFQTYREILRFTVEVEK